MENFYSNIESNNHNNNNRRLKAIQFQSSFFINRCFLSSIWSNLTILFSYNSQHDKLYTKKSKIRQDLNLKSILNELYFRIWSFNFWFRGSHQTVEPIYMLT